MNIRAGRAQIHRALSNLIHNARDAMQDIGAISIASENFCLEDDTLAGGSVPRGEYVKLTISDTGHGIPEEIAGSIFDPFFTTKPADRKRGSGLGLSVVDAVVKDHHGYVDLRTRVGEGTSFYLYFPVTRDAAQASGLEITAGGSEHVLVVDDDDVQRQVSTRLLQKLGYTVETVSSGEAAVEITKTRQFDLLILDMIMPGGMDGADTFERIRSLYPDQKAIVVSGYAKTDQVQRALALGAGAFIKKPLTSQTLATAVRSELDRTPLTTPHAHS
jgi:CheY-like chemotaxis protein